MAKSVKRDFSDRMVELNLQGHSRKAPGRRRGVRLLLAFFLLLFLLVGLAPTILSRAAIANWAIARYGNLDGTATVESLSFGWVTSIEVRGITAKDGEGHAVAEVPAASLNRTLLGLILNHKDIGSLRIERPRLTVAARTDGSNIEDYLKNYLTPNGQDSSAKTASSGAIGMEIVVEDGSVLLLDQTSRQERRWECKNLYVKATVPSGSDKPIEAKISSQWTDGRRGGKMVADARLNLASNATSFGAGVANVNVEAFPLSAIGPALARFTTGAQVEGDLNGEIHAQWGGEGSRNGSFVQADAVAADLFLSSTALGDDALRFQKVNLTARIDGSADEWNVQKAELVCDVGGLAALGKFKFDAKRQATDYLTYLRQSFEVQGGFDVARLAAMLPNALHVRKETKIVSGQVQLALRSQPGESGGSWTLDAQAANLAAENAGKAFNLERPLIVRCAAHETKDGFIADELRCESDFLKIHGSGEPNDASASVAFDLSKLADQLSRFVDLGDMRMAGEGWGNLNWKRGADKRFDAELELQASKVQVAFPNKPPMNEELLQFAAKATGQTDFTSNTKIETATATLAAGQDRLDAQLRQPVDMRVSGGTWPIHASMQGLLQNWFARAATFVSVGDWRVVGQGVIDLQTVFASDKVELSQLTVTAQPLVVSSPSMRIEEPKIELTAAGDWDGAKRRLQMKLVRLISATVSAEAQDVVCLMPEKGALDVTGAAGYRANLNRVGQWFVDRTKPAAWSMAGELVGNAQMKRAGGVIQCETVADINGFSASNASGQRFAEPRMRATMNASYDPLSGVVQLNKAEAASSFFALGAGGRVNVAQSPMTAEIDAGVNYDLQRISAMLEPYLGKNIRLAGRRSGSLAWRGPINMTQGRASADLTWDAASIYGLEIGAANLKPRLADGVLQIDPLQMNVNGGQVYLAPKMFFNQNDATLVMPAGPLVKNVQITKEMCASGLMFVAPFLAGVSSAQGAFSIDLDGCKVPLSDPSKGDLAGRFTVHSIDVGPGPFTQELGALMGRRAQASLRKESVIPFWLSGGRVYHRDLELVFPEFTVKTHGSVGFDETLAITAELPVPSKWLENNPLATTLKDQKIQLPIGGTLTKPQLDQKVVQAQSAKFIRNATRNAVQNELNKQLDRLLPINNNQK